MLSNMFTNLNLTDMETGFKVFKGTLIRKIAPHLITQRFGFEPEITARISKIKEVKISKTDHRNISSDWFNIPIPGDYSPGVLVKCIDCIKKYESPGSYDSIDEQVFQCRTMSDVKEVLKALEYLRVTPFL